MLRRSVQQRRYDWESLLALVLQLFRTIVSQATGFTPNRLSFGREMRLPVDPCTPLPEPPRDVCTYAPELAQDLGLSYKIRLEIIKHGHKRAENCYNERVVERVSPWHACSCTYSCALPQPALEAGHAVFRLV